MPRYTSLNPMILIPKKGFRELEARAFEMRVKGKIIQGLVVKKGGKFFAYENLCMHLAVTLDLGDENFFTHEKDHLQCHMHGAMYQMETGYCVAGPCQGARLKAFDLIEEETRLVIKIPESQEK